MPRILPACFLVAAIVGSTTSTTPAAIGRGGLRHRRLAREDNKRQRRKRDNADANPVALAAPSDAAAAAADANSLTKSTIKATSTTSNSNRDDDIFKCPTSIPFEGQVNVGMVNAMAVSEASGLVASSLNPGILFTHNDFGHGSVVIASREDGTIVKEFLIDGAESIDYEDIAAGPGPVEGMHYLYVGDIGDGNRIERDSIVIYRVPEPVVDENTTTSAIGVTTSTTMPLTDWDALTLTYPGRVHNAESLMLDPMTGLLYIISRTDGSIWRTESVWGEGSTTMKLVRAGTKKSQPGRPATGADISRDGREILVKHYSTILYYCREPDEEIGHVLSTRHGVKVPYKREIKGESVAFAAQRELGYYTLSESGGAVSEVPIYRYNRIPGR
mmetsp:Transcript_35178/g.77025  ORF Transcript_35178/g.77025 Transcript_35178/m.77025 type:complete len:387 (+) Transcript_35178:208-1368(+)